jgi:hypothetical protein
VNLSTTYGTEERNDEFSPFYAFESKKGYLFFPDANGGVYFRNNVGSFRMEGNTIAQWIEKLMPMFNGEYTLDDLTEGLPTPYRERVYVIDNQSIIP